jgi:hypothetical protein
MERDRYSEEIIVRNWIPMMINWISLPVVEDREQLHIDILWIIANMMAGTTNASDNVKVLLRENILPVLMKLLDSDIENVGVLQPSLLL